MMVRSIVFLLSLSVLGDAVANWSQLPVPGPAVGLALLVAFFVVRRAPDQGSAKLFDVVSPFFPLFFVPAAAGIVANLELFLQTWIHVFAAVVLGTIVAIAVTGMVAQILLRMIGEEKSA